MVFLWQRYGGKAEKTMINLKDFRYDQLEEFMESIGEKRYRAKQIYAWLHKPVRTFDEMTNISKPLREKLAEKTYISVPEIVEKYSSSDGTVKYLWRLSDGQCIESVVMKYKYGYSICVSSQVGCAMGCKFCASTIGGKVRNLSPGEILDQILFAGDDLKIRISNVVMMGIGEPLDNFENVVTFLDNIGNPNGILIGYRHISLSTCGIVKNIYRLADLGYAITLSVSLHAANDAVRNSIMPVNRAYPIEQLLKACRYYITKTGRRISFEYTMIAGKNDGPSQAKELANLLSGMLCHVNLIPVNEVEESGLKRSSANNIQKFKRTLEHYGLTVTVRRELGKDIHASCGQLRRKKLQMERGNVT